MSSTDSVWTIEELVAITDEVQESSIEFRGKPFNFQFCELSEEEEPKFDMIPESASEKEKQDWYTKVGNQRIVAMIEKANDKNPKSATISSENWSKLPTTLRYSIAAEIMGVEGNLRENFTLG